MAQTIEEKRAYQRDYHRQWRKDNPDKHTAIMARYYAKKIDEADLRFAADIQKICAELKG
jgi:hypothetical protein